MRKKLQHKWLLFSLLVILGFYSNGIIAQTRENPCITSARYFYWVGGASDDFFDENNWRIAVRNVANPSRPPEIPLCRPDIQPKFVICKNDHFPDTDPIPANDAINPGRTILHNLYIEGVNLTINVPLVFACAEKGITLHNARLTLEADLQGFVNMEEGSTLRVTTPGLPPNLKISLRDNNSFVYFNQVNPIQLAGLPVTTWPMTARLPHTEPQKLINQYYQKGSVLRMDPTNYKPLTVYSSDGFGGSSATVGVTTIYSGSAIPGGMNDNIRSFKLKRGFMATIANNANGTGKSKVYIASENDLEVSALPVALSGNVSFIRVMPWNWVTKKGTGGLFENNPLDAGWFYTWSAAETSKPNNEYVPMTWGAGATSPSGMQDIIGKKGVTHLLGFNESDNCEGESGRFNNLCRPDVAVAYYERLMGSGLKLGTPAPRENGPTTWLREFARIAKERDVRFDFVAVHWYDWGSNPASTPNASAQAIFDRFKAYLTQVYNEYQLPIWVTEFNANPNRPNATHAAFLALALPYLESLSYVERYAYFQPSADNSSNGDPDADYFDDGGNLTNIGQIYLGHTSTPSMPAATYECPNNLEGMNQPLEVKQAQEFVFEAECGKNPGSKWMVVNNSLASNGKFIRGNNALSGASELAKQIHYDIEVVEENNFRLWIRARNPGTGGTAIIHVDHEIKDTITGITSADFTWHSIPRLYTFKPGKHRITLSYIIPSNNTNIVQFDQIAMVAGSDGFTAPVLPAESCTPESFTWGLEEPAPIFAEGEAATKGAAWTTGSSDEAIGDQFVESGAATSPAVPPGENGWLTFNVDVTTAGAYQFWAKMQSLETGSNKLWIKIGDGDFQTWSNLTQPGYLWKWKRFDSETNGESRQEFLFLAPGNYTFTIAYASGGIKVDRIGLVPAETSPTAVDPDVIAPAGPQSFEAEQAQFLGTAALAAACAAASNGQIVNMGTAATNGLKFNNILVGAAGNYQLAIAYFVGGTDPRSMRVFVNGTLLPIQRVAVSGPWCFEGGSPGTWLMTVPLVSGANTIELRPVSTFNAPFIDKIEIRPIVASFEAEQATLSGTMTTPVCSSASNSTLLNMGNTTTNSATFSSVTVPSAGTYQLNITYFSKLARNMRISINGGTATSHSFAITGNWCFESPAGVSVVKAIPVTLQAGVNIIRFQPPLPSGEAPVLDKIDIVDPSNPEVAPITGTVSGTENQVSMLAGERVPAPSAMVYPNPARAGSTIYVPTQKSIGATAAKITLYDARGAAVKSSVQVTSGGYKLPYVPAGVYLLQVNESGNVKTYRVVIE
jgi:Glycosyl hydrolase catalytic core/Secretion system C-terminal sorting domain